MDREILSKLLTLLRHKIRSKMDHFAALDSAYVYKTIRNQEPEMVVTGSDRNRR